MLSPHGRHLFFMPHVKDCVFNACCRLHFKVLTAQTAQACIPCEIKDIRTNTWQGNVFVFLCFLFNPTEKNKRKADVFEVSNNFVLALEPRSQCIPQKCLKSETREE